MLQKGYLASEKHYTRDTENENKIFYGNSFSVSQNSLTKGEGFCDVCSRAITSPICQWCLAHEVRAWMTLYSDLSKNLMPKIVEYLKKSDNKAFDSTMCIKCGYNSTSVCPACFIEFVLTELEKMEANKIIVEEFLEFFDQKEKIPNPHAEKWGYFDKDI